MGAELPHLTEGEFRGRLERWLPAGPTAGTAERLYAHFRELSRWNRRVALVGRGLADDVVDRLYGESLAALPLMPAGPGRLLDVGSGAGFPGFVLAAARPDLEVILVEARQRKWAFLRAAAQRAALSCTCLNARVAAALPSGIPESLDRITVRALRLGPAEMSALAERLSPGGSFVLWERMDHDLPPGFARKRTIELPEGRGRICEATPADPAG